MFESATLKLTGWYLLIVMVVSLLFSGLVYQSSVGEVTTRLQQFGEGLPQTGYNYPGERVFKSIRDAEVTAASHSILLQLVYINIVVLLGGGIASYLLARHTLKPIEAAHEAQSRFTSDASHELRTPLAAMKTELEVALRDPKLPKTEMRELLESNLEEVDKLTQLSQTLLALSRSDLDTIPTEDIDIREVVRDIIKRFKLPATRITYVPPDSPIIVHGNPSSIGELVTILIDNAVKYSPSGSIITATTRTSGHTATLVVTNTGDGIAPDALPHIFDRFYRADSSRSSHSKPGGYGLGLSLARRITDLHSGSITATSQSGKETTFTVTLPLTKSDTSTKV